MSPLEQRYRSRLRLLPTSYREAWEEDMVAAFLESVDTGDPEDVEFARPSLAESLSVVSLAIGLRLGAAGAQPRPFTWGQAVRLMTLVLTLTNAVIASGMFLVSLWLDGRIGWLPAPAGPWAADLPAGVWQTGWSLTGWAWILAYIALTTGHRRAAQALALFAIIPAALSLVTGPSPTGVAILVSDALLVGAMVAFPEGDHPAQRRRWLLALPVAVVSVPVPLFALAAFVPAARYVDWPGVTCALAAVAVLTYQMAARRSLPTALALTMLAAWMIVLRLVTLPGYLGQIEQTTLLTIGALQATTLLAVGLPLAVTTIRAVRSLPPLLSRAASQPKQP